MKYVNKNTQYLVKENRFNCQCQLIIPIKNIRKSKKIEKYKKFLSEKFCLDFVCNQ